MLTRLPNLGALGVINDTVGQALPIGAFSDARNVRFAGVELQKMLEPTLELGTAVKGGGNIANPQWLQFWTDGLSSYAAIAANETLYVWDDNGVDAGAWRLAGGPYSPDGNWQSFAWGDTIIFNNGIDTPQIYNTGEGVFDDLPGWGLISTGDDILNNREPSKQVDVACTMLVPFKSFLVACGVTEEGLYQPNKVWWSDSTNNVGYDGAPNWDYETPASLSGQVEIDPESGSINTAVQLNENLIIYTDSSATAMTLVGGSLVMQFRRLFNKGAAGLHCVCEFNNQHFAVAQDQIYLHDGSTVTLIAKDRIEDEFFRRIGKGGRFGDASDIDWNDVQVAKNPDRKEVMVIFGEIETTCIPVVITTQPEDQVPGETCKEYACDAYDSVILLGDVASLTMTDELSGASVPLTDKSGATTRTASNVNIVEGPFVGADFCLGDNFVDRAGDFKYRVLQNGGSTTNSAWIDDPAWVTGMDDVTVHGFFKLEPLTTSSVGTIIGFNAISYEFNLDVRIRHEADNLGDKIQLYWIGQAGGNSPRSWESAKIPEMNILTGELFWFGAHIKREGIDTNATVTADFYFSDLQPGSTMQKVASMPAGTLTGALWKFSKIETYGSPLSLRVQMNEFCVINSSSTSGDASHVAVEWGELTGQRLADLQDGYDRSFITYVDPNCIPDPTVTFTVAASGTEPVTIQWLEDGAPMAGETGTTLTVPSDSVSAYTAVVSNDCGTEISNQVFVGVACKQYECDALHNQILELNPSAYYPMNIQSDLDDYPNTLYIKDYINGNNLTWDNAGQVAGQTPNQLVGYSACGPNMTATGVIQNTPQFDARTDPLGGEIVASNDYTVLLHDGDANGGNGDTWVMDIQFAQSLGGEGNRTARFRTKSEDGTVRMYIDGTAGTNSLELQSIVPDWRDKIIMARCWWDGNFTQWELFCDFVSIGTRTLTTGYDILRGTDPANLQLYIITGQWDNDVQEYAIWNRRLSDLEIASLKAAFEQANIFYVDPNPNCIEVP